MSSSVGIDVAKAKLAIVLLTPDGKALQKSCANTAVGPRGFDPLAGAPRGEARAVGLEATGGYQEAVDAGAARRGPSRAACSIRARSRPTGRVSCGGRKRTPPMPR